LLSRFRSREIENDSLKDGKEMRRSKYSNSVAQCRMAKYRYIGRIERRIRLVIKS